MPEPGHGMPDARPPATPPRAGRGLVVLLGLLTVVYPLIVYLGIGRVGPAWVALVLVAVAVLRACITRDRVWWLAAASGAVLALATTLSHAWLPLMLYPVLVNLVFLGVFAISLRHGPPVIERIARLREPELSPRAVAYTRKATLAWCIFLAGNAGLALATTLWASKDVWALYNGFLAYILIGCMFSGEWLVRRHVRSRDAALEGAHA